MVPSLGYVYPVGWAGQIGSLASLLEGGITGKKRTGKWGC